MNGSTVKKVVLKSFEEKGLIDLCAKFQTFTVTLFMFFVENYHIFYKYLTEIFFSESLANFSPISNRFIRFYSNLSKIWA